jgi:hypothetical protein
MPNFSEEDEDSKQVLAQDFSPDNFQLRIAGAPIALHAVTLDKGPKRIAIVLDASTLVSPEDWQWQLESARKLLAFSREMDTFAFVLVSADTEVQGFVSRDRTKACLKRLRATRPVASDAAAKVYETLTTAAQLLDPPQFGDTVVFFGQGVDSGTSTQPDTLKHLFVQQRLRFYALVSSPTDSTLSSISQATGSRAWLTSARWKAHIDFALLYNSIAKPYRLTFSEFPPKLAALEITLLPGRKRMNVDIVTAYFPRLVDP